MNAIDTEKSFNVHQRVAGKWDGQTHWRIGLTTTGPVAIDYHPLIGLAIQFGLNEADVTAVIGTEAFPAQLLPPGQPPRGLLHAQWAYAPAVTALLALGEAKLNGRAQ